MNLKHILAATSAALLLSVSFPASALDIGLGGVNVSVGSGSSGGTSATVGTGSTSVTATVGGGGNVASANVGNDDTNADIRIGSGSGPLVATSTTGDDTSAAINLGSLLGILSPGDGGGNGGGGGGGGNGGELPGVIPPNQVADAYTSMSSGDQARLQLRCRSVLMNADGFDRSLVDLCRIIWKLQAPGG